MTRPLSRSLLTLVSGVGLLAAAGLAAPATFSTAADAPKGGTVRIMSADELDHVDPALGYTTDSWLLQYATCAKLFNHPDQPGTAGARPVPSRERAQHGAVRRLPRSHLEAVVRS